MEYAHQGGEIERLRRILGHATYAHASRLTLGFERIRWVWDRHMLVGLRARLACPKKTLAAPGSATELEVRYALGAILFTAEPVREVSERPKTEILELRVS